MIHYIDETIEYKGKKVLLRLDLNVPTKNGQVVDTFRLDRVIETVDFLREKQAQVIIIAHCENDDPTLVPVWHYLNGFFPLDFCPTWFTPEAVGKMLDLKDGKALLFENVRNNAGEKENDPEFAKKMAQMGDIYVDDAFAVAHRKHASIVGLPALLPHFGGFLMRKEIENLSKAFSAEHPFLFLLGGAKFDTKLPIIKKYLERADCVFVGGALANNFFKELGYEIGTSLIESGDFGIQEMLQNQKLMLPLDVTVMKADGNVSFKKANEVSPDECIVDVGPETLEQLKKVVSEAKTILWNGPLGNYEKGFADKTESLAEIISQTKAVTIVGGGDTLAAIEKLGLNDKFTFVSTGGGAMLDFLVDETLVGIEALKN